MSRCKDDFEPQVLMACGKNRRNYVWGGPVKQPGSTHAFASERDPSCEGTNQRLNSAATDNLMTCVYSNSLCTTTIY